MNPMDDIQLWNKALEKMRLIDPLDAYPKMKRILCPEMGTWDLSRLQDKAIENELDQESRRKLQLMASSFGLYFIKKKLKELDGECNNDKVR